MYRAKTTPKEFKTKYIQIKVNKQQLAAVAAKHIYNLIWSALFNLLAISEYSTDDKTVCFEIDLLA